VAEIHQLDQRLLVVLLVKDNVKEDLQPLDVSASLLFGHLGGTFGYRAELHLLASLDFFARAEGFLLLLIKVDLLRGHCQVDFEGVEDAALFEFVAHDGSLLFGQSHTQTLHQIAIPTELKHLLGTFLNNVCSELLKVVHDLQVIPTGPLIDFLEEVLILEVRCT
jgi:hypothetical protein